MCRVTQGVENGLETLRTTNGFASQTAVIGDKSLDFQTVPGYASNLAGIFCFAIKSP